MVFKSRSGKSEKEHLNILILNEKHEKTYVQVSFS